MSTETASKKLKHEDYTVGGQNVVAAETRKAEVLNAEYALPIHNPPSFVDTLAC
jgi:hypothetical protein